MSRCPVCYHYAEHQDCADCATCQARAAEPVSGPVPAEQVARWKEAVAAHNAALRNRRGKRPGPGITGIRINPGGTK